MTSTSLGDLDPLVEEAMAEWQVPGLAIAVVLEGEPILLKAYGRRDVEADLLVTTDTQFALCSITKTFTAAGLGMLVDEGRLDWTKPVREYLPEFRLYDSIATDRVTVVDLLCHHSGLPRHDWVWMPSNRSRSEMLAALRYLEPSQDIRSQFQYLNAGYVVAGTVAERVTGQSWEDFTSDRLMKPLGMKHFGYSIEELERAEDAARPYVLADEEAGTYVRRRAPYWPIGATPAGGVNIAISDMAKYLSFHLAGGCYGGTQLLSPTTLRAMQTPRVYTGRSEFEEFSDQHYGLGFSCFHYRGERVVGHTGSWIGWGTDLTMLPDRHLGVAILTNRAPSPVPQLAALAVVDRISGKDPIPWLERFRTRRRQAVAQRQVDRQARDATRKPDAAPSRALSEYIGDYEHPGYGRITIEVNGDALQWQYCGLAGELAHRHYDVFEVPENPGMLSPDLLPMTFAYDREGNINRLSAPFEPMVADIVFVRAASGDVLDPAFRASCGGTYQGGAIKHVVALGADGQLTLLLEGQRMYHLVPYQGRTFSIRELEGFRVEFQRSESGAVNTIIFHQPNGTFSAQRTTE